MARVQRDRNGKHSPFRPFLFSHYLHACVTSVHRNRCSGDETRVLAAEESDDRSDLEVLAEPVHRAELTVSFLRLFRYQGSIDDAGADAVDADALVSICSACCLGQVDNTALRCGIRDVGGNRGQTPGSGVCPPVHILGAKRPLG